MPIIRDLMPVIVDALEEGEFRTSASQVRVKVGDREIDLDELLLAGETSPLGEHQHLLIPWRETSRRPRCCWSMAER